MKFLNYLKKLLSSPGNWLTLVLLAFVLWRQSPSIINNFQSIGVSLETKLYPTNPSEVMIEFPPRTSKAIAIYWASWCAPCKLEMNRLESSVKNKNIDPLKIFAINAFESNEVINKFIKDNNYSFQFIQDETISKKLNIQSTPTTLFIENGSIKSMSSGISLIGIWRAELFLN